MFILLEAVETIVSCADMRVRASLLSFSATVGNAILVSIFSNYYSPTRNATMIKVPMRMTVNT
jgi:hypothetical protein